MDKMISSPKATELALDVDFESARAIHRIVRGMNDGECPRCHYLTTSARINLPGGDMVCPMCDFTITKSEKLAAIKLFGPIMAKCLEIFEEWRKTL